METKKIFIIVGIIILVTVGCIYIYISALASSWSLNNSSDRPYYITTKPIVIKNILLPKETKIEYKKRYFWEKHEQNKPLNKEDITEVFLKKGITIDWGGVPITRIVTFYNSTKGFTVFADFNKLDKNKETQFSKLWQSCYDRLSVTVKSTDDWSFNKNNILDVNSCGVTKQRYFSEDTEQQKFLDNLYNELIKTGD